MRWDEFKRKYDERGTRAYHAARERMRRDADAHLCWYLDTDISMSADGITLTHHLTTLTDKRMLDFGQALETPLERMIRVYGHDCLTVKRTHPDTAKLVVFTITEPLNLT